MWVDPGPVEPRLAFRLLGPLEVSRAGVVLDLGPPKQRAILAALLIAEGRVVSGDRLIESVWGDDPPPRAISNIQVYVSKLRSLLQDGVSETTQLARRPPGYVLTTPWVDVAEFRRLTALATESIRQRSWSAAVDAASAAVGLWRGPFLDDLADEPWVSTEANHLDELYAQAMEAWVTGLLGQGNIGVAITRSQTMVESYPLREHCWWLRMIALHRAGRSPEALAAYQHFTGELDEQLGLEPGPELRTLQIAILRHDEHLAAWPDRAGRNLPGETSDVDGSAASEGSKPARIGPVPSPEATPVAGPSPTVPALAGVPVMVGRETQLAALDQVIDDVIGGQYRWVLLTGRAGIGKTRLATESVARARQRGARTVWTSCPDDEGTPAWWPLRRLITELGRTPDEVFLPPTGVDADTVRFIVYERFSQLLNEISGQTPLLVVIDDAQWLDAASLRGLSYLVRTQRLARVGFVLTVRDRERRPEFDEVLATIGRQDFAVHLAIEPLDGPDASQLLRQVGGNTISAADAFALMRRTGGNPLLLTEYARLPPSERQDGPIPLAARGLLELRLRRLSDDVLAVLRAAAVIGETFEVDLLAAVTDLDMVGVLDRMDAAAAEAIIEPASSGQGYRFRHGLLRDAVTAELTVLRRQALHARIAEQLTGRGRDQHTLIRRAHHLSAAMPIVGPRAVVDGSTAAARAAEVVWDWDAAAQQWQSASAALELVPAVEQIDRDNLLIARLAALARAGRAQTVLDTVASALDTADTNGETTTIGRMAGVLLRTSGAWPWPAYGSDPSALLARLDQLAPRVSHDAAALARVLAALAVGNCYHPDRALPDTQSRQALEIAEQIDDADVLADALIGRALAYAGVARHAEEAAQLLDRLAALPHSSQLLDGVQRHNLLTMVEFSRGNIDAAADHLEAGILGSDRLRLPVTRVQLRWVEAMLAEWHGDLDRAQELANKAHELHQQTELYSADVTFESMSLAVSWNRGHIAESPLLDHAREPLIWGALAAAETSDLVRGRDFLARRLAEPEPEFWYTLAYRTWLAHAIADLGAVEFATGMIDLLDPNRNAVASLGQAAGAGPVALATGKLRAIVGDVKEARSDLAIAEQLARDGQGRLALVRIRLAQLTLEPPTPTRAQELHDLARDASHLGMHGVVRAALQAASV